MLSTKAFQSGWRSPRRNVSLGTLFGVMVVVLFFSYNAGFLSGKKALPDMQDAAPEIREYVATLQQEKEAIQQKLIVSDRNYQILIQAQKNLEEHLNELLLQNTELKRDMALYHTIAGTPATAQGLEIKAFHVYATEQENKFRYLIVLSKEAAPQKFVQGAVTMTILGHMGEKAIQLPVKYVDSVREDGLAFKFRHLQELAGELSFPDQFVPEEVAFQVTPDADWPIFQQNFPFGIDNVNE